MSTLLFVPLEEISLMVCKWQIYLYYNEISTPY